MPLLASVVLRGTLITVIGNGGDDGDLIEYLCSAVLGLHLYV